MRKYLFTIITFFVFFVLFITAAQNVGATSPSCSNPQGELKVHYSGGEHGIVGDGMKSGVDDVYFIDSYDQLLQCFCGSDGNGIQTDWLNAQDMCTSDIEEFTDSGWIYVPNGADWGLMEAPYLARNSNYSCGGEVTPTPTLTPAPSPSATPAPSESTSVQSFQLGGAPQCTAEKPQAPRILSVNKSGTQAVISWTKVDKATHYTISYGTDPDNLLYGVFNTGNVTSYTIGSLDPDANYHFVVYAVNDCMPSDPSSQNAAGGAVLGMASTGGSALVLSTFLFGTTSTLLGLNLRNKKREN